MNEMSKSIDDIILSIESNEKTIDDMLSMAREHNNKISGTMHGYAENHASLNSEQINAYADYAKEYNNIKKLRIIPINKNKFENIHNKELLYMVLDEIHTEQIGLMERLCTVIEKAIKTLKLLCIDHNYDPSFYLYI